jgi:TPR repeat protein
MADQKKLPVAVTTKDVALTEQSGDLVTRGLEAIKKQSLRFAVGCNWHFFDRGADAYDLGDFNEAIKCWRMAAEQGHTGALQRLAHIYCDTGKGSQDFIEVIKWWRKEAALGNIIAQTKLGEIYHEIHPKLKNIPEAVKWYRLAAERGNVGAQTMLGQMYKQGEGVPRDYAEAVKWYRLAAERGGYVAGEMLGFMYSDGRGVPKDYVQAYKWFACMESEDDLEADLNGNIAEVTAKMTPQQIAEAQKLAREWKSK